MKSTALLRKEVEVARDNLPAVIGLLVLLPAAFAGSTLVFEDVLPRDSPVAVVSDDHDASTEQLEAVADVLAPFADATVHEGDWRRALEREEVYLAIQVPGDLEDGEVVVHHHGAVVPFDEPSELLVSSLDGLSRLDVTLSASRETHGATIELGEYLLPVLLTLLALVVGLVHVPGELRRERRGIDRLALDVPVHRVALAKIGFYALALALPVLVFHGVSTSLGYSVDILSPPALAFLLVTYVYAAALGSAVMFAVRLSPTGRLVNAGLLFAVVVLSNPVYPLGFFSSLRREIAWYTPTYHSALGVRSHATKDVDIHLFADRLALLTAFALVSLALLYLASRRYERR